MNKHTPGPWEAKGYWSNPESSTLVWDKDAAICHVFPRSEMASLSEETARANARLIAAAPDLLLALIWCEARLQSWQVLAQPNDEATEEDLLCLGAARAAITRAKGAA